MEDAQTIETKERTEYCYYCNEYPDGGVKPFDKNGHIFVWLGINGHELNVNVKGWRKRIRINFCPMCGRDFSERSD